MPFFLNSEFHWLSVWTSKGWTTWFMSCNPADAYSIACLHTFAVKHSTYPIFRLPRYSLFTLHLCLWGTSILFSLLYGIAIPRDNLLISHILYPNYHDFLRILESFSVWCIWSHKYYLTCILELWGRNILCSILLNKVQFRINSFKINNCVSKEKLRLLLRTYFDYWNLQSRL